MCWITAYVAERTVNSPKSKGLAVYLGVKDDRRGPSGAHAAAKSHKAA